MEIISPYDGNHMEIKSAYDHMEISWLLVFTDQNEFTVVMLLICVYIPFIGNKGIYKAFVGYNPTCNLFSLFKYCTTTYVNLS